MRPPALARLLVAVSVHREDRPFVLQDLRERFSAESEKRGPRAARRWYWGQALGGVRFRVRPDRTLLRRWSWEGLRGELRLAARALVRRPLYALGVTGTLALGLGAAALTTMVAWHVWLAPMPFPEPDGVVRLFETEPDVMETSAGDMAIEGKRWRISPPLLEDLRAARWASLEAVAGVSRSELDWSRADRTGRVSALRASPELLPILGVVPAAGRLLSRDVSLPEVLLTVPFWRNAFGADPEVTNGRTLILDGMAHRVVGVVALPDGYPGEADIVAPLAFGEEQLTEGMRGARYLDVVARVSRGHSVNEAGAELDAFVRALGEVHPQHRGWGGDAVGLAEDLVRPFRGVLSLLLAAGFVFLTLAVVNVGGLVAARRAEAGRARAVRLALGASEGRLVRAAMTEGSLLGVIGAGLGVLAAYWLLPPIRALVPQDVPRLEGVALDATAASVVLVSGLAVGVLVGVAGYLMSRGVGPSVGREANGGAPGMGGRRILVAGQVALTTLLATGGLAVLSYSAELRGVDVGFEAGGVLNTAGVLSDVRYPDVASRGQAWRSILAGLEARGIPAAVATNPPMAGSNMPFGFTVDAASEQAFAQYHSVSPRYFDVLGIDVLEGRVFGPGDRRDSEPVLVISEAFRDEHFPDGSAVGREITVVGRSRRIVGVVASTRHYGPDAEVQLEMYVPLEQDPWGFGHVLMDTDRTDAAEALTTTVGAFDPDLVFPPPAPYGDYLRTWYAPLRLQLVMIGALALLGLTLATLGLYALVAYHVSTRRREIGIRMALGAPIRAVFRGVVRQGLGLAFVGGSAGLAAWYTLAPIARRLVGGIDPWDPGVPLVVVLLVGGACLLATLVPAWRSMSVDPVTTLKAE